MTLPRLPVSDVIPDLLARLQNGPNAVLVAPPGAGKTTLVPLALLDADWRQGRKIIMLEPRRLAARAAANRMAQLLDESVGGRVGYRVRFDTKASKDTVIEVVTGGVFARMMRSDPMLENVAAVLFDEFHERSLDGDLAMALCLDLQTGLRDDLRLLAMSATLDGAAVAELLNAPVVESEGRAFPVEISHREGPTNELLEDAMLDACRAELARNDGGDVLVFLPGQREIERCYERLAGLENVALHRLYGAIPHAAQQAALAPDTQARRKIILSSAIAETSLTIDGVDTVIDSGLARLPVFEPSTGLTRLQTVRASLASITQRAGRAGRLRPGRAVRLWREQQTKALPAHTPPEITNADLSALLLDLAEWGVTDPTQLQWLDVPPAPAIAEARTLLVGLEALRDDGTLTPHGREVGALPLDPRLAHMVVTAAKLGKANAQRAALLALLVQDHGAGGRAVDISIRTQKAGGQLVKQAQRMVTGLQAGSSDEVQSDGLLLAHAYRDRIARRSGPVPNSDAVRFKLANGRAAQLAGTDQLAGEEWLVVVDMVGAAGSARIVSAAELSKAEITDTFSALIEETTETTFDAATGSLKATRATRLGSLVLDKPKPVAVRSADALPAMLQAVRDNGLEQLPWRDSDRTLRHRLALLAQHQPDRWPAMGDDALLEALDNWLAPFLDGETSLTALATGRLTDALMMRAGHPSTQELDRLVPTHFDAPSGSRVALVYGPTGVSLGIRPQELFGLDQHPAVLGGALPIDLELLSPAGRPIQLTRDLPGFWRGSWRDVRADLRGRYPKHPWPEDPLSEPPTRRVKPRK
ncbi:ATP-dependent helicase HrpB [Ahrensia sp. R2A130]|uniref:ATP-dependent helicase HrpB n=1 Tax=Ahrensia sp. R2A130 TaxID=744979 RepID=UPI0001E0F846|nr:ATP-dependent helicase HrpB [Ahrensia sp. R2A130]